MKMRWPTMGHGSTAQRGRTMNAWGVFILIIAVAARAAGAWAAGAMPTAPNPRGGVEVVIVCDSEPWLSPFDYSMPGPTALTPASIQQDQGLFPVVPRPSLPSPYPLPGSRSDLYWNAKIPSDPSATGSRLDTGLPYAAFGPQFRPWPSVQRCRPVVIIPGLPGWTSR